MTPKQIVLKKYPRAFGWRQFSTSDYTVESGTGKTLASALYAKDAWKAAATAINRRADSTEAR